MGRKYDSPTGWNKFQQLDENEIQYLDENKVHQLDQNWIHHLDEIESYQMHGN